MDAIGDILPPPTFNISFGGYDPEVGGLIVFFNNILRLIAVIGGLWAFFNLVLAGYGFLGAGDDPKKIEAAWGKIWQSLMGLLFIVGSFVLAGIFGYVLFGNAQAILMPAIYGPGS